MRACQVEQLNECVYFTFYSRGRERIDRTTHTRTDLAGGLARYSSGPGKLHLDATFDIRLCVKQAGTQAIKGIIHFSIPAWRIYNVFPMYETRVNPNLLLSHLIRKYYYHQRKAYSCFLQIGRAHV